MSIDDDSHLLDESNMPETFEDENSPEPTRMLMSQFFKPLSLLKGIFCILGVGMLTPWNAFISAKEYFQARFCMAHMESTFVVVYTLSSVIAMGIVLIGQMWWEQRNRLRIPIEDSDQYESVSNNTKSQDFWFVRIPLITCAGVFLAQAVMVTSVFLKEVSALTLLSLTVSGVASVVLSAGVVAVAGSFTQADYAMNPYLQGQSLGGVVVSFANLAAAISKNPADYREDNCIDDGNYYMHVTQYTRALDNEAKTCGTYRSIDWGMFVYFISCAAVLVMCLIGHSWIEALRSQVQVSSTTNDFEGESERIGVELLRNMEDEHEETIHRRGHQRSVSEVRENQDSSMLANYGTAVGLLHDDTENSETDVVSVTHVLWLVRGPTACIFMTFVITLALFPGWTSELTSVWKCKTHFRLANDLYTPFTFVIFNLGDLFGRLVASRFMRILRNRLVIASLLRAAFVPLLLSCNSIYSDRFHIPSDLYSFLVQITFSISNGVLLTASFAHAPTLLSPSQKEEMNKHMSEILSFTVALGLLGGSLLSFPVSSLLAT